MQSLLPALVLALAGPALAASSPPASAQEQLVRVAGVVLDAAGQPVAGASIAVGGSELTLTDAAGRFSIELPAGEVRLRVTHPDHPALSIVVIAGGEADELTLRFEPPIQVRESVTVVGIRADEDVPVTKRDMARQEIETRSHGQDVPALLEHTPSITWYSDSGVGSNYSYFSLRGIQQTRINMTYDGAPLNDPAEHALFFNNFHDFTSEVDSIQIQRGVGTSSVGAPSYGGSVNFASRPPSTEPAGDVRLVLGAYDTQRASIGYGSGPFGSGLWASGRFSFARTDGYRDSSGTEHRTFFFNGGWQGERSSLKLTGFSGDVQSQLSFLAVDPDTLAENRRFNPLDEEERDDFGQDFVQLRYTHAVGTATLLTASAYYNGASGWFRLWDDPVAQNELLQFGIDQGFWGSMVTATRTTGSGSVTAGVHYNDFSGDHTLDVAAARIYENTGFKNTLNAFVKADHRVGRWILFGDLQLRWAEFSYDGDVDLGSIDWTFLDPRVGVRSVLSPSTSLYASVGRAQREPTRMDLLLGEDNATVAHDLRAVVPESVVNFELGVNHSTQRLALQANLYAMEFTDEIALTGELSDIGLPLRRNVADSFRRGFELDLKWRAAREWTVMHSLNLSHNRISEWTQFYDVYDAAGSWIGSEPITYTDVPPLLTPEAIVNLELEWSRGDSAVALSGRHVSHSQLDNTGLPQFRLPAYTTADLRATVGLGRWWAAGRPRLNIFVNNLLDNEDVFPSGYSYQFLTVDGAGQSTLGGIPFYYPMATRHVVVTLLFDI